MRKPSILHFKNAIGAEEPECAGKSIRIGTGFHRQFRCGTWCLLERIRNPEFRDHVKTSGYGITHGQFDDVVSWIFHGRSISEV